MPGISGRNIILRTLKRIKAVLPAELLRRGIWVFFAQILSSVLDILGLATLIPVFSVILEENAIQNREIIKSVYDKLGFESEISFIIFLCVGILLILIIKNLVNLLIKYYEANYSFSLYCFFGARLQQFFYQKGFLYLKDQNSNQVVRDINEVSMRFGRNLMIPLLNFLNEVTVALIILAGLMVYEPRSLILLALIIVPAFLLFYRTTRRKTQELNEDFHELKADVFKSLYESVFGFADVEINNRRNWFFQQYQTKAQKVKHIQTWLYVLNQMPLRVIETAMILGILVLIVFGLMFFESREQLTLLLGIFALAAYRILPSINRMLVSLLAIKGNEYTIGIIERVKELPVSEEEKTEKMTFRDTVNISDLSFAYPQRAEKVLDHVSFTIKKGEAIGIIGRSGSGKTTLANIFLRFLKETDGNIAVDNVTLNNENIIHWRELLGYVQQEVFIIDGTLAENIAFGHDNWDEERLYEVLDQASLTEVVNQLPKGIHTRIGERGAQLSGGQRQRVGIARALYSGAEILVFDEATSALDSDTEREITESIQKLSSENLTMLIIAHRVTTLKYCDKIIELEEGKIHKIHTYEDLIVNHL